jgi:hypothetical protein
VIKRAASRIADAYWVMLPDGRFWQIVLQNYFASWSA